MPTATGENIGGQPSITHSANVVTNFTPVNPFFNQDLRVLTVAPTDCIQNVNNAKANAIMAVNNAALSQSQKNNIIAKINNLSAMATNICGGISTLSTKCDCATAEANLNDLLHAWNTPAGHAIAYGLYNSATKGCGCTVYGGAAIVSPNVVGNVEYTGVVPPTGIITPIGGTNQCKTLYGEGSVQLPNGQCTQPNGPTILNSYGVNAGSTNPTSGACIDANGSAGTFTRLPDGSVVCVSGANTSVYNTSNSSTTSTINWPMVIGVTALVVVAVFIVRAIVK